MPASRRPAWLPAALLVGVVYVVVGRLFAVPADHAHLWRLAAWLVCGVLYAVHIGYERFGLRQPTLRSATHVAVAVAIGGFGLAVVGMLRSILATAALAPAWLLALVLWPIITAVPAFLVALVALVAAAALGRFVREG